MGWALRCCPSVLGMRINLCNIIIPSRSSHGREMNSTLSYHQLLVFAHIGVMLKLINVVQAAESGNVDDFMRLYLSEPSRLAVRDSRGRTAAHQAAARNNTNILQFINNYAGG